MPLLASYSIKNAFARRLTSILTLFGIALVVFVFCAVLMLSEGLRSTLVQTGGEDNMVALRQAATTEVVSIIPREMAEVLKTHSGIAADANGVPMVTGEVLVLINQQKRSTNQPSNIPVRGVDSISLALRPNVKIVEGRMWRPGSSEIIAGRKVAENFQGCGIGEQVKFGMRNWTVVGTFEANGSGFESEVWGDIHQLMAAFERPVYSSITFQKAPGASADALSREIENDRRLTLDVMSERDYYRRQSQTFTTFIVILGTIISVVFSLGAIVGAMITMYASVANRTTEIGTLRALGFKRGTVLMAFLIESLAIATIGGLVGIALAGLLQFKELSTTNFDTFAEIAFPFRMSAPIALQAFLFSVVMGIVGGFLPAVRASRLKIVNALKAQ